MATQRVQVEHHISEQEQSEIPLPTSIADLLEAYSKAVERCRDTKIDAASVLQTFLLRDRIVHLLNDEHSLNQNVLQRVVMIDTELQGLANRIVRTFPAHHLVHLRETRQPPDTSWWWRLDERVITFRVFLAPLTSLALIATLAFGLITIFQLSRIGINVADFSAVLSVILPLLAGSALTVRAHALVGQILSYLRVPIRRQPWIRLVLACTILAMTMYFFLSLPGRALQLNNTAVALQERGELTAAIDLYRQAVQLNPSYAEAYYNLGTAYEQVLRFDDATESYKTAYSMNRDLHVLNNLARVYLAVHDDPRAALRLLDPAIRALGTPQQALDHVPADTLYVLYKNRGWALLGLGLLGEAGDDLQRSLTFRSNGAAAHCLLAQWYEVPENKSANAVNAHEHWEQCVAFGTINYNPPEPEWLATARDRLRQER